MRSFREAAPEDLFLKLTRCLPENWAAPYQHCLKQDNPAPRPFRVIPAEGIINRRGLKESLNKIREELKGEIPIIGVGGIDSPLAVREKMAAGADLIQIYTSFIYKGPKIIKDIVENI